MWELIKSNFWVQISIVLTLAGIFNYALRIPAIHNTVPILFDIEDSGKKFENLKYFALFLLVYLYFLWQVARNQFEKASLLVGIFNLVWIGIISFLCSSRFFTSLKEL
jgi:hypothetical protein